MRFLQKYAFAATILWAMVIAILSLTPGEYIPKPTFEWFQPDTLAHFIFYAVLNLPVIWLVKEMQDISKKYFWASAVCISYGFGMEFLQIAISGRFFDWQDLLVNTIGAIAGAVFFHIVYGINNKSASQ